MSRKNHKMVDGKLLQTDKKYSNLKMKQKENINLWIGQEIREYYKENGRMPRKEQEFQMVLDKLYDRIEKADIWIPYGEIHKRFMGSRMGRIDKIEGQIRKEERSLALSQILIEPLEIELSVCKVADYSQVDLNTEFCFTGKTDVENSLVCLSSAIPENVLERDDGWRAMRIRGTLDFSLIGVLSGISSELARQGIGIFAISTFNTDYILVKDKDFAKALESLSKKGYQCENTSSVTEITSVVTS